MKNYRIFIIIFLLFLNSNLFAEENRNSFGLQIFFISNGNTYEVYNNENEMFTNKIVENLLKAPRFKSKSKSKSEGNLIPQGYYLLKIIDNKSQQLEYKVTFEKFVYNLLDGNAYEYDFCSDFYEYITYKFILNTFVPKEEFAINEYHFGLIDYWDYQQIKKNIESK